MTRIVKTHAVRRNEILDVAGRLIYTKGYEQMTIQDILDGLQISKGAFYHYFDSKQALLEAIIERMQQEVEQILLPIVQDQELSALEKLDRFFATASSWKTARKDFFSPSCVSGIRMTMPLSARNCGQLGPHGLRPGFRQSSIRE